MPIGFVFSHGWGFDSSYFDSLSQLLIDHPQIHWESNYFKNDEPYQPFPEKEMWIGIGHSLGFQKLLEYPFQGLISLSGFNRFCVHQPGQEGTLLRVLDKMINSFQDHPRKVLENFWRKCGIATLEKRFINKENLLEDLKLMKSIQENITLDVPILNLYNIDDPIVPKALSLQIFKNCSQLTKISFNGKDHLLGLREHKIISGLIRKWLNNARFN